MTTDTAPTLTDTIHVLGEIRDHLRHHPRWVEALSAAASGLHEAGEVIAPFARAADEWVEMGASRPVAEGLIVADLREAADWLTKHGARP